MFRNNQHSLQVQLYMVKQIMCKVETCSKLTNLLKTSQLYIHCTETAHSKLDQVVKILCQLIWLVQRRSLSHREVQTT